MKAELVNNLEDLKAVRQLVNELQIKDSSKKIIKSAINDAFKTVNKKLYIIESREKTKLETKMIDNHKVTILKGYTVIKMLFITMEMASFIKSANQDLTKIKAFT
ncbi:hypothetical protein ACLMAB_05940 [Brevibacillus laterosporus]